MPSLSLLNLVETLKTCTLILEKTFWIPESLEETQAGTVIPHQLTIFMFHKKKRRIFESSINLGLGVGSGLVNSYYIYMGNRTEK